MKVVAEVCKACFNLVNLLLRKHSEAQLCKINVTQQPMFMYYNQVNGQTATIITV